MNYKTYPPSTQLKSIVKQYIVFNSVENIEKILFLPSGSSFIIFNRGANLSGKLFGVGEVYPIPKTYSLSLKTNKVKQVFLNSECDDEISPIIAVELLPIGLYKLFNIDMTFLKFQYMEIEEKIIIKSFSKLYTNDSIDEDLKYLDSSLIELEKSQNNSHLPIEDVINKINDDFNLDITIEDILKEFGYSRSTLERHSKKYIGLTPKNFIYIVKFCNTILDYINQKKTFTELQYIYSDNSHMNAVFQNFLGIAPSEIFKKIVNGEFAIYQLLNIHKEELKQRQETGMISVKDVIKYSKKLSIL